MNLVAAFRPNTNEAIAIAAGRVSSVAPPQFSTKRAYAATFAAMLAIRLRRSAHWRTVGTPHSVRPGVAS